MGLALLSHHESSLYAPRSSLKNTVGVGLILTTGMAVRGKKRFHEETRIPVSDSELILSCSLAKGKLKVRPSFEGGP